MARKHKFDFDLIVIGSGAGGSTAAILAARAGLDVALIESKVFGGNAPNFSDIPTSAMLHVSHLYDQACRGSRFGISSSALRYNFPTIQNWKNTAIKRTGSNNNRRFYENAGIKTFAGHAHFLTPNEVSINRKRLTADRYLIATGSEYLPSDIKNLENINYYTPETVLNILRPPKSMFIIGGGSSGAEVAQIFSGFGTKVTIADIAARLLPKEDEEVGQLIGTAFSNSGTKILTESRVIAVEKESTRYKVIFLRGGQEKSVSVDEVVLATSKTPATDIGLENAGVKYSQNGIEVSDTLQTSIRHIFAAGDVIGGESSTTKAIYESTIAANNILHRNKSQLDYTGLARLTNTFPEVASVGYTEDDCIKRDLKYKKSLAPISLIARSNTADFRDGFVKLITDFSGNIIGATVVCPEASSMIAELSLAIKYSLTSTDIANTPHSFLTWGEAIRVAAARIK